MKEINIKFIGTQQEAEKFEQLMRAIALKIDKQLMLQKVDKIIKNPSVINTALKFA